MSITFVLPELGENIEGGTVSAVRVTVGDRVEKDQTLLELETDKAVVEVPAPAGGIVAELNAAEGSTLNVGDVVAVIDDAGAAEAPAAPELAPEEPESAPAEAALPPPPPPPPPVAPVEASPPPEPVQESAPAPTPAPAAPAAAETPATSGKRVAAAPSVRRFAREIGIDITQVSPGQAHGRLTKDDIKNYSKRKNTGGVSVPSAKPGTIPTLPLPTFEKFGDVRREKMSKVREMTAQRMAIAWGTIPHVTQHDKADITKLEEFRKQYGPRAEQEGGKLTPTAILVKVLAAALKEFPEFNTSVDVANQEIIHKGYYNIGVAVDTPRGLIVPVLKNVDRKSIIELSVELNEMAARARDTKTTLDELQGACITVTNLGGIGGTSFTPIVNPPEVAILGVSRGRLEPVYVDGQFEPRLLMPLSLSYDHRVIDGANAARFTRWLCEAVENPFLLLLEG